MLMAIGIISFLGAMVFSILGFIALFKRNGTAKQKFMITGALFILFVVAVGSSAFDNTDETPKKTAEVTPTIKEAVATPNPDKAAKEAEEKKAKEAQAKADAEAKAKEEAALKKKNQEDVLAYEKAVYALEDKYASYFDNYTKAMEGVGNGSVDIVTAYNIVKNAIDASEQLQMEMSDLEVPKDLPKEAEDALNEAKMNMSTAYFTKGEALGFVLKYFDDQKPSHISNFQEEIGLADQFILSGVMKILEAKTEVGIELIEETQETEKKS